MLSESATGSVSEGVFSEGVSEGAFRVVSEGVSEGTFLGGVSKVVSEVFGTFLGLFWFVFVGNFSKPKSMLASTSKKMSELCFRIGENQIFEVLAPYQNHQK